MGIGAYPRSCGCVLAILVASPGTAAHAQQNDAQFWFQLNTNIPVASNVRVTLEQIARFSDRDDGLYQTEFGGLIGWRVAPDVELGFGYRRVGFHSANTAPDEDRFRQQVAVKFGRLATRLRFDARFNTRSAGVGIRIRPLARYSLPLPGPGRALFVSHESFILPNSTLWGQRSGYERMRNIVGLTLPIGRSISADIGYLNQYRLARSGAPARMDHALNVQLTLNFSNLTAPPADD